MTVYFDYGDGRMYMGNSSSTQWPTWSVTKYRYADCLCGWTPKRRRRSKYGWHRTMARHLWRAHLVVRWPCLSESPHDEGIHICELDRGHVGAHTCASPTCPAEVWS